MLRPGLCSVTLRKHSAPEVIRLAAQAGLSGIEWGGDVHVPPGDLANARNVGAQTRDAGLAVISYGSYYRLAHSEAEGMAFAAVLETALALEAPVVRTWAGTKSPEKASPAEKAAVVADAVRIASLAHSAGVRVALEFHANTLTETLDSAQGLLRAANHANLYTLWQPIYWGDGATVAANEAILRALLPRMAHLHVFTWEQKTPGVTERFPLAHGETAWRQYLSLLTANPAEDAHTRWLCLEFVAGDSPDNLSADAATLKHWLSDTGAGPKV
ncbi:MAG: TIM barrel protein [Akkermansiaceae bacterium]|nr:TIM barrel protein [Armatimonadota bacterium]